MDKIYGINPVKIFLQRHAGKLKKIFIASGRSGSVLQEIIDLAKEKNIPVEIKKRNELDTLSEGAVHQGVVAFCTPYVYREIGVLLDRRSGFLKNDLVLILDSIMDPQNLGSIIRSAYGLGANGVIIPADRAAGITPAVIKASAGSALQMPVARVTNLSQTIDDLKARGFWIYGADIHAETDLRDVDFCRRVALVLGGEAKGIRPLLKKKCDVLLKIPMARHFDSFNVASASAIIQYEIFRQQHEKTSRRNNEG